MSPDLARRPCLPAADRESRTRSMTSLVILSCLAFVPDEPQSPASRPPGPAPADVVASIETVMADAIATAEPSVVAIHRLKGENTQETLAVRGRKSAPSF